MKKIERVYFETSAFNYFLNKMRWKTFLGTRDLQEKQGRELFVSPITLWELMLSREIDSDFMLFAAQNIFSENLLATPSELVVRYIHEQDGNGSAPSDAFTKLPIGALWKKMASDNGRTMRFDQTELIEKTNFLRLISKNLSSIVKYPEKKLENKELNNLAKVMHTVYECMEEDGFLTFWKQTDKDVKILAKLYVLWVLGMFVLRFDLYNSPIKQFIDEAGLDDINDPIGVVMHITEKHQKLMYDGPIWHMTLMSYHQLVAGRKNRGLLLDSMHCAYFPYIDTFLTNDGDFNELATQSDYFSSKTNMVENIVLQEVPYIKGAGRIVNYIVIGIYKAVTHLKKML